MTTEDRIAEYWPNIVVYNITKIDQLRDERWIMVVFLEDLVHAYYGTLDEEFAARKGPGTILESIL